MYENKFVLRNCLEIVDKFKKHKLSQNILFTDAT